MKMEKNPNSGFYFLVDHEELKRDIWDAYLTKEPLFIWGRTGIGKSWTVRKVAEEIAKSEGRKFTTKISEIDSEHFFLMDKRLTYRKPTDLTGAIYRDENKKVACWLYPEWIHLISREREEKEGIEIKGIVFLDELNLAPPLVQNAAYELILDRKIDGLSLADGVVILAAGNLTEDEAYTFEMPKPLRTRFTHVVLKVPPYKEGDKGWFFWAIENGIDSRIIAFLGYRPDLLFQDIDDIVFPTPRGWEKASKLMKNKSNEEAWRAVAKACGMPAAMQFKQFLETTAQIDIEKILKEPEMFSKMNIDMKFGAISGLMMLGEDRVEDVIRFAAMISIGVYDMETYNSVVKKTVELSKTAGMANALKKALENIKTGEKYPEFSAMILCYLNQKYRNRVLEALKKGHGHVLANLLKFAAWW
ncbi:MAG: MoxR family ATPase [Candidatus Bathyarchaeia archaeon]